MTNFVYVRGLAAAVLMVASLAACSSSDDDSGNTAGGTTSGLSASFGKTCATCHGAEGRGAGIYPSLPGGLTEADFIATVRNGKGTGMAKYDATVISDADLKSDYAWLSARK